MPIQEAKTNEPTRQEVHPKRHRRLPVGAEVCPEGGVHFRVWAARRQRVEVMLEKGAKDTPGAIPLAVVLAPEAEAPGYFSALVPAAGAGTLYRYRLDGGPALYPDPVSRFQPSWPPGPSQVIEPGTFQWTDGDWPGVPLEGQVIYEMHLGTFTPEGTWEAASRELPELADAGMTLLEIMPVAAFPGRFGWGYDGVNLFAPTQLYGTPDACRRFVDQAHALGLGVILSAMVALTGRNEAYYTNYGGTPQEFISAFKWGYLYQGQRYTWQKQRRGTPAFGLQPATFVTFFQNHDQIANSGRGLRCHLLTSPGRYKALTAVLLLGPGTPMLFQGQEFAASSPFLYFADFPEALARLVRQGRAEFLKQFRSLDNPAMQACLPHPEDPRTFERSKLDLSERQRHTEIYALHRDLLRLRRQDPVLCEAQRPGGMDGAVLGPEAFVLRFFGVHGNDRLLIVNLGRDLHLALAPEPLLAPPAEMAWQTLWSSEAPRYGGSGPAPLDTEPNWQIPGHAAVVLWPAPVEEVPHA